VLKTSVTLTYKKLLVERLLALLKIKIKIKTPVQIRSDLSFLNFFFIRAQTRIVYKFEIKGESFIALLFFLNGVSFFFYRRSKPSVLLSLTISLLAKMEGKESL
jgi:hypothetical protein